MPESWAVFPSSSSWANKNSDLPLCLGALPCLGAPTFQPFQGWGIYSPITSGSQCPLTPSPGPTRTGQCLSPQNHSPS